MESDIAEPYISWLNNKELMRYSNQRFVCHDVNTAKRYFESFENSPNLFLAIEDAQITELVGTLTVYVQPNHSTADIGILVGCGGRGYGKEAWGLVVNWLIRDRNIRKVTAGTLECNASMLSLMRHAGMTHEATRKGQEVVEGRPWDILYFARYD
jgi:RimJ/RimL family protein N-acetyltransferase